VRQIKDSVICALLLDRGSAIILLPAKIQTAYQPVLWLVW